MKVIVYTRPRIKTFFHELAKNISGFTQIKYMSDHKGEEEISIMDFYYEAKDDLASGKAQVPYNFNFARIIQRCRYLRSLNPQKALQQAKAMSLAIHRIVDLYQPDIIFGMVMDSYVLDIVDQVMRERGSQYVGFLNNMINGYSRLTARGELIQFNQPTVEMVEQTLQQLQAKHYIPNMQKDFMWNTSPLYMYFTKYLKEKIKIIYYFMKKIVSNDPDNFYYNTVAAKSCMSCRSLDQLFFRRFEDPAWLKKLEDAKAQNKVIVYMPLQFYPECSVDYWGTNLQFAAFYTVVEKILANKYKNILFLVKEHPSAMGLRKSLFYSQFSANPNVILTPFDVNSNDVIEKADLVLTWTGSVGIEAIMRGKPLATFGEAYYDPGYGILKLDADEQLTNLESILINHYKNFNVDKLKLQKDVLAYILRGLIPGYVFPLDYKTKKNPENLNEIKNLAAGISNVLLKIKTNGSYAVREGCV